MKQNPSKIEKTQNMQQTVPSNCIQILEVTIKNFFSNTYFT